jgi:hypothetical protein
MNQATAEGRFQADRSLAIGRLWRREEHVPPAVQKGEAA